MISEEERERIANTSEYYQLFNIKHFKKNNLGIIKIKNRDFIKFHATLYYLRENQKDYTFQDFIDALKVEEIKFKLIVIGEVLF